MSFLCVFTLFQSSTEHTTAGAGIISNFELSASGDSDFLCRNSRDLNDHSTFTGTLTNQPFIS